MNRRVPVKKNYFSFLSGLSASPVIRTGFYLTAGVAIALLGWAVFSFMEIDASAIFGVLALVVIPVVVLVAIFAGVEKITGISCLRGVEWLGKNTLLFFGWIIVNIQKWRGIEPVNNHDDVQVATTQPSSVSSKEQLVEIEAHDKSFDKVMPDFEAIATGDPLFAPIESQQSPAESQAEGFEAVESVAIEQVIIEENITPHEELLLDEVSISNEPSFFDSDVLEEIDTQQGASKEANTTIDNVAVELSIVEQCNEETPAPELTVSDEFPAPFESNVVDLFDRQHDINRQDKLDFIDSELDIDDVERELKSLFQEEQGSSEAEQITPADSVITEIEDNASEESMLLQAGQTAANILSSFSESLSKSFSLQQTPEYYLPSVELLQTHEQPIMAYSDTKLDEMSRSVERVLKDYKILAEVVGAYPGPIITRFELSLAPGIKVSRVSGLAKDLARAMLVTSVRVVEIIEGTPYIGLEIPNQGRELVSFREIISSEKFQQAKSPLTLALGKDVAGQTVISDLAKMPHLLVAGTTGSGKSVAINTMILSMLYKSTPEQVRMIMVDPKMLELSVYEGIPHLLTPVVTDMNEAQNALRWAVAEMERRYKLLSKVGVRNLEGFNQKIEQAAARGETIRDPLFQLIDPLEEGETFPVLSTLPNIVIVIDELADMMMIVGKKVEELIARLAQKARAAGIHLVLATQRPSVDVLTGLIKANVPTRISFQVSSRIDSRTILDQGGAEALLGNGDMLFLPSGTSVPIRSHGAFVSDDEVHAIVDYLKTLGVANYISEITQEAPSENTVTPENVQDEEDELYPDVVHFVLDAGKASISSVQRRFKVGYNRAARMIDQMEEENIISEPEGNGSRRVLNREE